jgi:hypothetical protein
MPHRTQKDHNSLLGRPDMSRLLDDLCHPDHIGFKIEPVPSRRLRIELVAQNDDEIPNRLGHDLLKARQRSEQ